ncbi:MAG TPA: imidazole glycerol phosphate synthase subunit HisH [Alphaproteobacteria bacterium]
MTKAVIIDYGSGNLRSAAKAFETAARAGGFGADTVAVTADPKAVADATHIVLPGQGAFDDCMRGLSALPGMIEALTSAVIGQKKPFLGICVGLQLMAARGYEHGVHPGLGWIDGEVHRIEPGSAAFKIPHMGWNDLVVRRPHPVFAGIDTGAHAYFVHSYHFVPADSQKIIAVAEYGTPVVAAAGRDNIAGTQFHPEKSQAVGQKLIGNFLRWQPR